MSIRSWLTILLLCSVCGASLGAAVGIAGALLAADRPPPPDLWILPGLRLGLLCGAVAGALPYRIRTLLLDLAITLILVGVTSGIAAGFFALLPDAWLQAWPHDLSVLHLPRRYLLSETLVVLVPATALFTLAATMLVRFAAAPRRRGAQN